MKVHRLTEAYDEQGNLSHIMCPVCFNMHEVKSCREGGVLSTADSSGMMSDVDLGCAVDEFLIMAAMMS